MTDQTKGMMTSKSTDSPSRSSGRSTSRALAWLLGLAAAIWLIANPRDAAAEGKRLVVLKFTGPKAQAFRDEVEKWLKQDHSITSLSKWNAAAKKLKATKVTDDNIQKVAQELTVDGVISGKVAKRGAKYTVSLTLRSGATGGTAASDDFTERGTKLGDASRGALAENFVPAIENLVAVDAEAQPEAEVAAETPGEPDPLETETAPNEAKRDDGPRRDDPRLRPFDIAVGMSFTGRRLTFDTNLTSNQPQEYEGSPVPGIYVAIETFPLAFNRKNRSFTRNIGVQFVFDRVFKLNSTFEKMNEDYDLPTTEQHLAAGLVYRQLVGAKLSVDFSARFNKRSFTIDRTNPDLEPSDIDIPDADYTYFDPGIAVGYLAGARLALGAGARVILMNDTGEMQDDDQYGQASVLGYSLEAGLDYRLSSSLMVRGGLHLTSVGFDFEGNGELSNNRDMDPSDQDVSSARDTYWGGVLSAGYAF